METVQKLAVPIAIVVAGALIAAALYFVNSNVSNPGTDTPVALKDIRGVQSDDHIRGNPNAPIVIVEYSDPECPFCKNYHQTMKQVMDAYGADGKVAWVYRHFPLDSIHPKARAEAQAMECAFELGGNDAFWKFTDRLYETTPSNNGFDLSKLGDVATFAGVDKTKFEACIASEKHKDRIQRDLDEVVAAGGRGTPHSIILVDGEQVPVEGGQPFDVLKGLIDTILSDQNS